MVKKINKAKNLSPSEYVSVVECKPSLIVCSTCMFVYLDKPENYGSRTFFPLILCPLANAAQKQFAEPELAHKTVKSDLLV